MNKKTLSILLGAAILACIVALPKLGHADGISIHADGVGVNVNDGDHHHHDHDHHWLRHEEMDAAINSLREARAHLDRGGHDFGGHREAAIQAFLDPLPMTLIAIDAELACRAGMLQPLTRGFGLSLGDRVCLALARQLAVPALTSDHAWQSIATAVGAEVRMIR